MFTYNMATAAVSVVVLEEIPCPRVSSRTNLQVLVHVLELQTLRKLSRTACVFETVCVKTFSGIVVLEPFPPLTVYRYWR